MRPEVKITHFVCSHEISRRQTNYSRRQTNISEEYRQYTSNQSRKIKRFRHVNSCTWKHKDLNTEN
jgi:hypothetical protein